MEFDIKNLHTLTELDKSDCSVFANCFSILCGSNMDIDFSVRGDLSVNSLKIKSKEVTNKMLNSYNSTQARTTENAACAVAFVVVNKLAGYIVVNQTFKGDRFDYWLEKKKSNYEELLLQNTEACMEVSGIKQEARNNTIQDRIKEKILQVSKNITNNKPCYIVVSEFSNKISEVKLYERDKRFT